MELIGTDRTVLCSGCTALCSGCSARICATFQIHIIPTLLPVAVRVANPEQLGGRVVKPQYPGNDLHPPAICFFLLVLVCQSIRARRILRHQYSASQTIEPVRNHILRQVNPFVLRYYCVSRPTMCSMGFNVDHS